MQVLKLRFSFFSNQIAGGSRLRLRSAAQDLDYSYEYDEFEVVI